MLRGRRRVWVWVLGVCAAASGVAGAERGKPVRIKDESHVLNGLFNVAALNRLGVAALSGSPSELGTFLPAFDLRLDSGYTVREPGTAHVDVVFARPQVIRGLALHLGDGSYRWSAVAAASGVGLGDKSHTQELVPERPSSPVGSGDEVKLVTPVSVRALRLTVVPEAGDRRVVIRELNLLGDQRLEAISLEAPSTDAPIGAMLPLRVIGYFSGGETREVTGSGFKWTVAPELAARMTQHNRVMARRRGAFNVTVRIGRFSSPALALEAVDAN